MRRSALGAAALAAAFACVAPARADDESAACADRAERGQAVRDAGKLLDAREAFAACASETCPAAVRKACLGWLQAVDARIPSIVPSLRDPSGKDVVDARVLVDGHVVAESSSGAAIRLDPGLHVLGFERAGQTLAEQRVVVREGERDRIVELAWSPPVGTAAAPSSAAPRPGPGQKPATGSSATKIAGISLLGAGTVALGVFAGLGATGISDYGHLHDTCSPRCSPGDVDALRTKFVGADVALGVGVASLATAVVLLVVARRPSKAAAASLAAPAAQSSPAPRVVVSF